MTGWRQWGEVSHRPTNPATQTMAPPTIRVGGIRSRFACCRRDCRATDSGRCRAPAAASIPSQSMWWGLQARCCRSAGPEGSAHWKEFFRGNLPPPQRFLCPRGVGGHEDFLLAPGKGSAPGSKAGLGGGMRAWVFSRYPERMEFHCSAMSGCSAERSVVSPGSFSRS